MIEFGDFKSHSGLTLPWKVNCDSFTNKDWKSVARIIRNKFRFGSVYGIPTGGTKLAIACRKHIVEGYPSIIVDDVMTTGTSMNEMRDKVLEETKEEPLVGIVVFDRGIYTEDVSWIWPIFKVSW